MRLFIAINLSDEIKESLCLTMRELQAEGSKGTFSGRENLHLTLVFLGEVERSRISDIKAAMETVAFAPFDIEIGSPGRFRRDEGDILWIGLKPNSKLASIRESLIKELKKRNFSPDDKPFKPHLTLGRRVVGGGRIPENTAGLRQSVTSMELMLSERTNGKLIYTPLYSRKVDRSAQEY